MKSILDIVKNNLTERIKKASAELKVPEDDFYFYGKRMQLVQLFQNLIGNAIKYQNGKDLPRVVIKAEESERKIRISIIDNGIGISSENLEKIFEPFKRLHANAEYKGSGIGLATCKKIVENFDSELHVTSEPGKGSCFRFSLSKQV